MTFPPPLRPTRPLLARRSQLRVQLRRKPSSLLNLLQRTSQSARTRFGDFQLDTLPYYKHRAQAGLYRLIVAHQQRRRLRKATGGGILHSIRRRTRRVFGSFFRGSENVRLAAVTKMTQPGSVYFNNGGGGGGSSVEGSGYNSLGEPVREGKERGSRRRKLAGYLKAANELRQSYQQSAAEKWASRNADAGDEEDYSIPGAFPDVKIVRHGHEELVLFPSYCKRHRKLDRANSYNSRNEKERAGPEGSNSAEWWKQEWEKYEDDRAIVDVDVRGWLYTPHRGPFSRKNRLLIGLARQLSGVPAPKAKSRDTSPDPLRSLKERHEEHEARREEEKIAQEAEKILRKGEGERQIAARGGYSEDPNNPNYDRDTDSMFDERVRRSESGSTTPNLVAADKFEEPPVQGIVKRASWNHPSDMDPTELASANTNLMNRLMPFLTIPAVATPITVFFYDDHTSQSRTVRTDEAGHFNLRAALDFVPTHVRVMASDGLSATSEVKITEPKGVSIISDVDDTIKHSSIGSGAREIFRNAFIRDLADLTIDGVREWYNTMYDIGCSVHYVSNSPWQLFPVLATFFQTAGLPPGSYHLKQYSGMLQGIFEPVAERKKGTLDRIMRDFPERKFLLIGDSGEADLELYTDLALANPGRVIGIYIRDVTTPQFPGFFDSAMGGSFSSEHSSRRRKKKSRGWSGDSASTRWSVDSDSTEKRPPLPARILTEGGDGPATGMLIDFEEEPEEMTINESSQSSRYNSDLAELTGPGAPKVPPRRPVKPLALRSKTVAPHQSISNPVSPTIRPSGSPTLRPSPRSPILRPLTRILTSSGNNNNDYNDSHHPLSQTQNTSEISLPPPANPRPAPNSQLSTTSEPAKSASIPIPGRPTPRRSITGVTNRFSLSRSADASDDELARSHDYGASHSQSHSQNDSPATSPTTSYNHQNYPNFQYPARTPPPQPVSKKVELWKRRWRRAREVLDPLGIELRSWREGGDVCLEAVRLVEREMGRLGLRPGEARRGGEEKVKDLK